MKSTEKILIILGAILLPLAGFVWWLRVDLLNTNRYVALVTPVVQDPAVQTAITNYITDTIFSNVDTTSTIQEALPRQNSTVAQMLNDALINFAQSRILMLVQSDRFASIWSSLNQAVHQRISSLLLDQNKLLTLQNGAVTIELNGMLDQVKANLPENSISALIDRLPQRDFSYDIMSAPRLAQLQPYVRFLDTLFPWINLLVFALFGIAIGRAADKTQVLRMAGKSWLMVAVVMTLILVTLRQQFLTHQNYNQYYTAEVATVFFDALTKPLWLQVGLLVILGVLTRLKLASHIFDTNPD